MNSPAEAGGAGLDTAKLAAAVLLLTGGIFAFYYFAAYSVLLRVLGLLAISGVAAAIALQTAPGRQLWQFATDVRQEVRKVVWPTRQVPPPKDQHSLKMPCLQVGFRLPQG